MITISSKLQDILHWVLVIALTFEAIEPAINQLLTSGHITGPQIVDGVVGLLSAAAIKFVYYAITTNGTTTPPPEAVS